MAARGFYSINGGASKTIIEMSKSSIRRLPKFKGGKNKFLAKNANWSISTVQGKERLQDDIKVVNLQNSCTAMLKTTTWSNFIQQLMLLWLV